MGKIQINDLTTNKNFKVTDMLDGYTYKITYTTGESYYVMVCYPAEAHISYSESSQRVVVFLDDGAINVIDDSMILDIEEINVKLEITN